MSPVLSRLMSAAAAVLRNCRPRYTRDEESCLDELASALTEVEREAGEAQQPVARSYMSAERALAMQRVVDAARELSVRVGIDRGTHREWTLLDAAIAGIDVLECRPRTADIVSESDAICRELQANVDAFKAGAEYMRRSARIEHVEGRGDLYRAARVPRLVLPDAERIDAAAAGYVEAGR